MALAKISCAPSGRFPRVEQAAAACRAYQTLRELANDPRLDQTRAKMNNIEAKGPIWITVGELNPLLQDDSVSRHGTYLAYAFRILRYSTIGPGQLTLRFIRTANDGGLLGYLADDWARAMLIITAAHSRNQRIKGVDEAKVRECRVVEDWYCVTNRLGRKLADFKTLDQCPVVHEAAELCATLQELAKLRASQGRRFGQPRRKSGYDATFFSITTANGCILRHSWRSASYLTQSPHNRYIR